MLRLQTARQFTLLMSMILLLSSCGNIFSPGLVPAPEGALKIKNKTPNSNIDENGVDSDYSCTGSYSIYPQDDMYADGSGYFSVCTHINTADHWKILVHGKSVATGSICLFPALSTPSGDISYIRDPSKGTPIYMCTTASGSGAYFSFPSLQKAGAGFNSAYIVESLDVVAMQTCLSTNYSSCPHYSVGRFR